MRPRIVLTLAALLGATAVMAGAFGAHGLRARVDPADLQIWRTAAHYQLTHALALLGVGLAMLHRPGQGAAWLRGAAAAFTAGILIFAGTLYAMVLGGPRWLGAITPLGGLALIVGWISLGGWALQLVDGGPGPGAKDPPGR